MANAAIGMLMSTAVLGMLGKALRIFVGLSCLLFMLVLQGLLENPPPSDNPHSVIICGDDQDAVTDAKQLIDCQSGFKVGSHALCQVAAIIILLQHDCICW